MSNRENDEEGEKATTVLTAQDRKKRILERRRQSLQRSQSMPTNLLGSSYTSPPKRSRNQLESFSRRSFRSPSSRCSVKSQLFPDENSSRIDSQSTVQTRLFSSDSQTDTVAETNIVGATSEARGGASAEARGGASATGNSLFGLVMQHSQHTPKPNRKRTDPTTPSQRMAKQLASPGGFGLVQMLSTVTSPFAGKSQASPKKQDQPEEDDWQESPLERILDWTINAKVRLECHPPTCLPGGTVEGLDEWTKALQYWQYPACADESITGVEKNKSTTESSKGSKAVDMGSSSTQLAKRLVRAVRGPNAYIHQLVRSEDDLASLRRRRQWQDAFQALYSAWLSKIENGDSDAYFYATTCDQVILFRATVVREEVLPMIVLSSTTVELRTKLRTRGIKYYVLRGSRSPVIFDESLYGSKQHGGVKEMSTSDEKKEESMVDTDMEALRKAQAYGETAGADVTVKGSSRRNVQRPGDAPPLYVLGHDDCGAFSTIFLNQRCDSEPLLMSRMGSFQNSTMKSLVVARQRTNEENAFVELLGPVLPCTIPALASATAAAMRRHATTDYSMSGDDTGLGSHYFVLQVQQRSTNESSRDQNCGLLVGLNGSKQGLHHSLDACGDLERVDVVVWDISRPAGATYKLDSV